MSKPRDHHYVPEWYQKGFFEPAAASMVYLDLSPADILLPNGKVKKNRSLFRKTVPARCFYQTDLYSTFFGAEPNVEIERMLFGMIDTQGSKAVKAMVDSDITQWHAHFTSFFVYMDAQKLRTPKGLEWLRSRYQGLSQNALMQEMQAVRTMHCGLWVGGVREVVSAEQSSVKFIISDHPVTVYNYALPAEHPLCRYPEDPSIALKASQTIFPLNRDFCVILTNLEYAKDPTLSDPTEKRTFARHFNEAMTRTDAFIRTRSISDDEVARINFIMKRRARRYVGAGREEWLYPERVVSGSCVDFQKVLLPPKDELWHFGGEMFASFADGHVHYQDAFGRREPPPKELIKAIDEAKLKPNGDCGCGSGLKYKKCCQNISVQLRPSWTELSIRERNILHYRAILNILGVHHGKSWVDARRELTDEKIRDIYRVFAALWPVDTDLLALLPKPDGRPRAIFSGINDPPMVMEFLGGAAVHFGHLLVQNPFLHG